MHRKQLLTYQNSKALPVAVIEIYDWSVLLYKSYLEDYRWGAQPPFECASESSSENVSSDSRKHMTPSLDHKEGEGIFIP